MAYKSQKAISGREDDSSKTGFVPCAGDGPGGDRGMGMAGAVGGVL